MVMGSGREIGQLRRWLLRKLGAVTVEFECECGRVNRPIITPEILRPFSDDPIIFAAWKKAQRRKLATADNWYRRRHAQTNRRDHPP